MIMCTDDDAGDVDHVNNDGNDDYNAHDSLFWRRRWQPRMMSNKDDDDDNNDHDDDDENDRDADMTSSLVNANKYV